MTCVALCLNKLRSGGLSFFFFWKTRGEGEKKKPDRWLLFELTKNKLKESHRKRPVFKTNPSWNNKGTWANLTWSFERKFFWLITTAFGPTVRQEHESSSQKDINYYYTCIMVYYGEASCIISFISW